MKLLFTLLSIGVLSVLAAQKISAEGNSEVTRLTLVYLDSTEKHFSLPDKPEITFEDARIHILSGTVDTYVDRSELSHFHFTKSGSTVSAIDDVWAQAENPVHMLNWAVRSVKFLGVEFDQSEDEEVSVSDAAHL